MNIHIHMYNLILYFLNFVFFKLALYDINSKCVSQFLICFFTFCYGDIYHVEFFEIYFHVVSFVNSFLGFCVTFGKEFGLHCACFTFT